MIRFEVTTPLIFDATLLLNGSDLIMYVCL
jgi:hypothetical protein